MLKKRLNQLLTAVTVAAMLVSVTPVSSAVGAGSAIRRETIISGESPVKADTPAKTARFGSAQDKGANPVTGAAKTDSKKEMPPDVLSGVEAPVTPTPTPTPTPAPEAEDDWGDGGSGGQEYDGGEGDGFGDPVYDGDGSGDDGAGEPIYDGSEDDDAYDPDYNGDGGEGDGAGTPDYDGGEDDDAYDPDYNGDGGDEDNNYDPDYNGDGSGEDDSWEDRSYDDGQDGDDGTILNDNGDGDEDADVPGFGSDDGNEDADVPGFGNDDGDEDADVPGLGDDDGNEDADVPGFGGEEEDDVTEVPGFGDGDEEDSEAEVPGFDDGEDSEAEVPGFDDGEDSEAEVPGFDDGEDSEAEAPGFDDGEDSEAEVPGFDDEEDSEAEVPGFDDEEDSEAEVPGFDDEDGNDVTDVPGYDDGDEEESWPDSTPENPDDIPGEGGESEAEDPKDVDKTRCVVEYVFNTGDCDFLPDAVLAELPDPDEVEEGETVDNPGPQVNFQINTDAGIWFFRGYDVDFPLEVNSDRTVTGMWDFVGETCTVTYEFASDGGQELPDAVLEKKPGPQIVEKGGSITGSPGPETGTEVEVEGGTWTFSGYDAGFPLTVQETMTVTGTWNFTETPEICKVTYEFTSDGGQELPDAVLEKKPEPQDVRKGESIDESPGPETGTEVEVEGGTWTFSGYDAEFPLTVQETMTVTGTWKFTETQLYTVTYKFSSGSKEALPDEVMAWLPEAVKAESGSTIQDPGPEKGCEVVIEDGDHPGLWTFQGYDQSFPYEVTDNATITGKWVFTAYRSFRLVAAARSVTDGKKVPAELPLPDPVTYSAYDGTTVVSSEVMPPKTQTYNVTDGYWTYVSMSPEEVTLTGTDAITFTLSYKFTARKKVKASLVYVSSPKKGELPKALDESYSEDVFVDDTFYAPDRPKHNSPYTDKSTGRVWTFDGYSATSIVVKEGSDNRITGTWTYQDKPVETYAVRYAFASETSGRSLPKSVLACLPSDSNRYSSGTTVYAKSPSKSMVTTSDGTWTFHYWTVNGKKATGVKIGKSDVTFTGLWYFTPLERFSASYRFVSGTKGYSIPASVSRYLPVDNKVYYTGNEVKAIPPSKTTVTDNGVQWTFQGYDANKKTVKNEDIVFTGTWTAKRLNETVNVRFVKKWVDRNNQYGGRPKKITVTLYKNGNTYQTYTCTAPSEATDTWSYTVKNLPKYENGREISWTVDESPVDGYRKSIDGLTITNTWHQITPGAKTGDSNPILLYVGLAGAALAAIILVFVLAKRRKK